MIQGMTAFARRADHYNWGSAAWEIRSVNHRYLDIAVRLPENMRELEFHIRERLRQKIQRGKIEVYLKYQSHEDCQQDFSINMELLKKLSNAIEQIKQVLQVAEVNALEILAWPGVFNYREIDKNSLDTDLLQLFDLALHDLFEVKKSEGSAIVSLLGKRLVLMQQYVADVKKLIPLSIEHQQQKLLAKFEEVKIVLDSERLAQEMLLMAQKIDINEEVERLEMHIREVEKSLKQPAAVGRRLDFLMQELHREANTMAAKTINLEISAIAIELRVLIEQMREQIQNIE